MQNMFWTIMNDSPPNPGSGNALNGLQIHQVNVNGVTTGYQLMNGSTQLKFTPGIMMPISFKNVDFASRTWDLTASLPFGPSGPLVGNGQWQIIKPKGPPPDWDTGDNGEFTAQAGTGMDPKAASSANA